MILPLRVIADELAKHTDGILFERDENDNVIDRGGLKCSCGQWSAGRDDESQTRPRAEWRLHVAERVAQALRIYVTPEEIDDKPKVDETHVTIAAGGVSDGRICSECGACTCHPKKGRDISKPCLKSPKVESVHPRGFTIDPSTVIEDEPLTIEEAAVMVGIDPGNPEAKPQHFIIDADGRFIPAGLEPGKSYTGRVRGHNLLGSGQATEFEFVAAEPGDAANLTPNPSTPFMSAGGGWCAPSDNLYPGIFDLPEVTAQRGGISFTDGPDFRGLTKRVADMTKKELRAEIGRLHREHSKALDTERARVRKLRKRNRRLLRLIEKGL